MKIQRPSRNSRACCGGNSARSILLLSSFALLGASIWNQHASQWEGYNDSLLGEALEKYEESVAASNSNLKDKERRNLAGNFASVSNSQGGMSADFFRYHNDTEINSKFLFLLNVYDESNPLFCTAAFGQLEWTATTTYEDLWSQCESKGRIVQLSELLGRKGQKLATILHQVPKTGSTSVRYQTFQKLRDCGPHEETKHRRPGYYSCPFIPQLSESCPHIESFGFDSYLTGESANYEGLCFAYNVETHFVHTIAFREYYSWARSAMNQVVKMDYKRKRVADHTETCNHMLSQFQPGRHCRQKRELDFRTYTKQVLRFTLKESLPSHPILLHDYRNVTYLQTTLRSRMGLDPLNMTEMLNADHTDLTCPDSVLEAFHECFAHRI